LSIKYEKYYRLFGFHLFNIPVGRSYFQDRDHRLADHNFAVFVHTLERRFKFRQIFIYLDCYIQHLHFDFDILGKFKTLCSGTRPAIPDSLSGIGDFGTYRLLASRDNILGCLLCRCSDVSTGQRRR
jgi:hypothetical protein